MLRTGVCETLFCSPLHHTVVKGCMIGKVGTLLTCRTRVGGVRGCTRVPLWNTGSSPCSVVVPVFHHCQ